MKKLYRKQTDTPRFRTNLYLGNYDLLKQMSGSLNYSWFIDELIAREYRKRERKATQPADNSALTAQKSVLS